ncbi:MAG: mechanosensitive ion channel family protein [Clostridia bacterium]|nr:mechanosensitive ion channel family protein [Clostridia bacterium]
MNKFAEWFNGVFGDGTFAKITGFALTVIVGIIIIKIIMAVIQNALSRSKLEKAAHSLIKSVVKTVLYALLALIAASSLGIDVTGIVALASVASLALSLALQNILTNIIGGFTLIYTKPFHSGDWVEIAGQSGTVKEIGMAYTKLTTADNKLVQIPNSAVVASEIINYTVTGTRRVDIAVSASYDAPVDKVLGALKKAADIDLILNDPALFAAVSGYGDHAISYVVRVWTKTENYWDVYNTVTYNIKKEFDENGIEMTYPHLNVHLDK